MRTGWRLRERAGQARGERAERDGEPLDAEQVVSIHCNVSS
jgi:hypothetical protein